jgi:hypothetical protein
LYSGVKGDIVMVKKILISDRVLKIGSMKRVFARK